MVGRVNTVGLCVFDTTFGGRRCHQKRGTGASTTGSKYLPFDNDDAEWRLTCSLICKASCNPSVCVLSASSLRVFFSFLLCDEMKSDDDDDDDDDVGNLIPPPPAANKRALSLLAFFAN